jgi:hypothetical protein
VLQHELPDPLATGRLDARCHVHQDQGATDFGVGMFADSCQRGDTAEGCSDQGWGPAQRPGHRYHVAGEGIQAVVAISRPLALAVAAQIYRIRFPSPGRQRS